MDIKAKNLSEKANIFLYFSAVAANLATFGSGGAYAWSSPAIPRLNGQIDPDNNPLPYNITSNEESWIASLLPLGAAVSTFISGYLSDKIGRKYTLLASAIPSIAGFTLLTFGNAITYFYIGRFLCGLSSGTLLTILPIYVGEIAQNTNRGSIGCFFMLFMTGGNLFFFAVTPYVTLRILGAINLAVPVIFALIFGIFAPESPYYYVSKKKTALAKKSLYKLRYNNGDITEQELPEIIRSVEEAFAKKVGIKDIFVDKRIRNAFIVAIILMCFQQWSGNNAVFFYLQSVLEESGSDISSDTSTLIIGATPFVVSACMIPIADKFGRRTLLFASFFCHGVFLFMSGIYFYLKEFTSVDVSSANWLSILSINLFIASYSIGIGPIAFTLVGELFPPHVKSFAATICIFVCLICTFFVTNAFPYLKGFMGLGLTLCFFGFICLVCCAFVYIKVPETKGKTLQEIQKLL